MPFIELTGKTLLGFIKDGEADVQELRRAGVTDQSLVRVNSEGDIELRRRDRWEVVGGLLGSFSVRLKKATGLDWA
jgi:hypothetical protein